jgi:diguanylate cyclase (GGDEF)-like protein/PAS domain S-box-containing protein
MDDTTRHILEQMAAGRIPDDIPDSAEYAETLRQLGRYLTAIQRFTIALSNGDLSQSLQDVTGPVAGGLKALQSGLRHLTWQTRQIAAGDFSLSVDFMGDFSSAFNAMVADFGAAHEKLVQTNQELNLEIEARKRAEDEHAAADDALRENKIFFNTLLNSLPLPVFYKDSKCRYIGFNNAYEEFFGKSRDELLGKSVFDIAPRELAEVYHAKDLELLRGQGTQVYESQVKDVHGVMHDVVFHKATFKDSDGRTIGLIGAFLDITERKRAENALIYSRQQLMDIIDFLPDATFVLDNDKRVIAWNRAIEEMTGISKAEMLGQGDYAHSVPFYGVRRSHLLDLLDIDDKELEAKYSYVVRDGNRLHAEMFTPALYGGKGAWVWAFGAPLYNAKGERIGAIEAVRDITAQKEAQLALNESRQHLMDIIEFLPDATLIIDSKGIIMAWNRAMEAMTGIKAQEMLGKGEYEYALPFYGERRPILIDLALRHDPVREKLYTSIRRDGDTLSGETFVPSLRSRKAHLSATASLLRDFEGKIVAAIECVRDNTEHREMEDALRASQSHLALALELSRVVKWELDHATDMLTLDDQFYSLYGTSAEREGGYLMPADVYIREFVHRDDAPLIVEAIKNSLVSAELMNSAQFGHRIIRRDGEIRDIAVKFTALRDDNGNIIKLYGANQDITEQKRFEKMLSQQARTDQMTGVNNRGYFLELLDVEIERASRYGRPLCLLMLDLDHFKSVNDTRGHAAGDEAIRTLTRVLQSSGLRKSDFLGRMGGEEFAVALPETTLQEAADAAERVRSLMAETPICYASENFSVTVSIGISEYRAGDSQETLLQRADQAMYQAKQAGRNRVCFVS